MIIIGFNGTSVPDSLQKYIKNYSLGGVILFSKNIQNPKQLKALTNKLQALNHKKLFIAIDQEGGAVQRLNRANGFFDLPSAQFVASKNDEKFALKIYKKMAKTLSSHGINLNFAPSVDLSINPQNSVIVKRGRSFSKDLNKVVKYASIFIDQMQKEGVICAIKHYPGHGSSLHDSHKGFVDVSKTWKEIELEPFSKLIKTDKIHMIMGAHIYNSYLDREYIATFSKKINKTILRDKLKFRGVLISDDLQMRAISNHYDLKTTLKLAINSKVDMLLFANQTNKPISVDKIANEIIQLIKSKEINLKTIKKANKRIDTLKTLY